MPPVELEKFKTTLLGFCSPMIGLMYLFQLRISDMSINLGSTYILMP